MPLFDHRLGPGRQSNGRAWLITAALHVIAVVSFVVVPWQAPWRKASYVVLEPLNPGDSVVYVPGTREVRAKGLHVVAPRPEPAPPPPAPAPPPVPATNPPDTTTTMLAYNPKPSPAPLAPQVGDGRLWVSPRPGLPAPVADALYGDTSTATRHSAAIQRLRAMVDSLNQVLDQVQREQQRPKWTIGGTPEKPEWGIDSAYIHVAGIKIPTAALALLGNLLPQGNFDEAMRERQLDEMRADLLRAADRAQTLQQFRRYVRELRERKQAERDAEERRHEQDTVKAVP